ncbi:SoxX protein [Pandoraea terrae]|uniref:SoxX protein n=1 Tax=Pandoraea terrae TaxID=1537710 RepID=A0A5E4Y177_9BURK|nr:sulfur oxidation c-type cytochrome SoxX [Pandoraea terrae]VVE42350.1 SoxX protein [Pandoraea terrae]
MNKALMHALAACGIALACATTVHGETSLDPSAEKVVKAGFAEASPEWQARLTQDQVQALCSKSHNNLPSEVAKKLEKAQLATIVYPTSGKLLGDWREGEKIAQEGRGLQFSDKPDGPVGGNCYACHQLSQKEIAYGTLGPSLYHYGKLRGNSEGVVKYTYGKIYNSEAYSACSNMPRFGHNKILNEQQIKDLVALLLDPDSPINK